jgi:hypothetical protein
MLIYHSIIVHEIQKIYCHHEKGILSCIPFMNIQGMQLSMNRKTYQEVYS